MKLALVKLSFVLGITALAGCAGLEEIKPEEKTFSAVYEAPGAAEKKIFDGTKLWIAENFRSARNVIDFENGAEGVIISKGSIKFPCETSNLTCFSMSDWNVNFTMRSDIKDGRFRLTFSNLEVAMPQRVELWMRRDLEAVKPKLLSFGPEIAKSIAADQRKKDF
jgi:hypothetical protein